MRLIWHPAVPEVDTAFSSSHDGLEHGGEPKHFSIEPSGRNCALGAEWKGGSGVCGWEG